MIPAYEVGERVIFEDGIGRRVRGRIEAVTGDYRGEIEYTILSDEGVLEEHVVESDIWPS